MIKKIAIITLVAAGLSHAQTTQTTQTATLPPAADIAAAITKANDTFIAHGQVGKVDWGRSVYETGNMRAARVLGKREYYQWALKWAQANDWKITGDRLLGDQQCCGQTYLELYRLDRNPAEIADITADMDQALASDKTTWGWVDLYYMAGPIYAKMSNITGDPKYQAKCWEYFANLTSKRGQARACPRLLQWE